MDYLLCGNLPYPAWKKHISVQNLSNRRIRRYLVCRLKRPEARDFSHVRFTNTLRYCNVLHSVHKLCLSCSRMPPFPRPFWNRRGFMHQQNKIDSRRQIGTLTAFCYKVKVSSAFLDLVLKRQEDRLGHSENLFALFSAFRGSRLSIAEDSL